MAKCGEAMLHGSDRISRTFDDDLDLRMLDQRFPVVGKMRRPLCQRRIERGRAVLLGFPADALEIGLGSGRREIRDADEMHTRRLRHLREIHGAELAGADQADAKRFALCRALGELRVQVHSRPALMIGSTMRGCRASLANGRLYRCAAKLVRTASLSFACFPGG